MKTFTKHSLILVALLLCTSGCSNKMTKVNSVVDTLYITDQLKYEKDRAHCEQVALGYDLTDENVKKAALYGVTGAGVATGAALIAGAGVINPVAIPLIVGATALGAAGGAMNTEERQARENIMYQCLANHGYTTYNPHSTNLVQKSTDSATNSSPSQTLTADTAKKKCRELGFKADSKEYDVCLIKLVE